MNEKPAADPDAKANLEGALLSASQIKWVKVAIGIMTALLAVGIPVLIGRVIYLARYGSTPAAATPVAADGPLAATARIALPQGADVKSVSLSGSRLVVHHAGAGGREEIVILDLTSGAVVSRVELTRGR